MKKPEPRIARQFRRRLHFAQNAMPQNGVNAIVLLAIQKKRDFKMIKCYFAAMLLTLFSSTYAVADDYLLRLETVGLRDLPNGDQEPDSGIPESIEIVVQNNNSFYGSATIGVDKISIRGMIQESQDEKLRVEIHYKSFSDTGEFVSGVDGKRQPIRKGLTFDSSANLVELGKPVVFDGLVSQSKRKRLTLLIDCFDPTRNRDQ